MFGSFPAEAVPDGAVFGPHHFYLGVLLILLVCWLARDPESAAAPWGVAGLTLLAVFSFSLTWPYYPAVGAAGVLILLALATALSLFRPFWWRYGLVSRGVLAIGLFLAWDDAVSHALGWWTPMDSVWARYLYPYVSNPALPDGVRFPHEIPTDVETLRVVAPDVGLPSEIRVPLDALGPSGVRPPADAGALLHLEPLVAENLGDALAVIPL